MKKVFTQVLIASMLAGAGFAASAQTAAPAPAPGAAQHKGMEGHHGMDPAKMHEMMAKRHAQRMADFKAVLRITPAQEGAWNAFAASMTPPAGGMMGAMHSPEERAKMHAEFEKLNTPQRMEKMRAMHAEREAKRNAAMDKHLAAVKTFYAALSPEQQKVFDITHKRMGEHRMGGHWGGHRGGGGMMHHE